MTLFTSADDPSTRAVNASSKSYGPINMIVGSKDSVMKKVCNCCCQC